MSVQFLGVGWKVLARAWFVPEQLGVGADAIRREKAFKVGGEVLL